MDKFDEKLFILLRRRIEYDLRIEEQELYCAKLCLSMASVQEESKHHKQLKAKVEQYTTRYQALEHFKDQLREQQ